MFEGRPGNAIPSPLVRSSSSHRLPPPAHERRGGRGGGSHPGPGASWGILGGRGDGWYAHGVPLTAIDILKGPLFQSVVLGSDVDKCKRVADVDWQNVNASVVACKSLNAADRGAWDREYAAWRAFFASPTPGFVGARTELEKCVEQTARLPAWVARLDAAGCRGVGPTPTEPTDPTSPSWMPSTTTIVVGAVVVVALGAAWVWFTSRNVEKIAGPVQRAVARAYLPPGAAA